MSKFNFSSNSNFFNNYYSSKIKEGIPIFQEENGGNMYNNYVDPFKLLENEKNNNIFNLGTNNYNINVSDIQTRKNLEKEMNPYLMRMKNELNLIIEKFRKEMNEKNNFFSEMAEIKQELIKLKQNSEENHLNIEHKLLDINDTLNNHENKLNNFQSEIFQINHMNRNSNESFMKNEIDNIKNKIINMDKNNDKYLKEMTRNFEQMIDYKLDIMNKNIDFIKEENNGIKNDLAQNNIKIEMLGSDNNKKNERLNDINSEFNNISNQINKIMINNNKEMNLINNLEINNNESQQKIRNITDKIISLNENLDIISNESKNQIESINSFLKMISELESNLNILENEKNSLNNKIMELNIKIEYQEEKISKSNNIVKSVDNENNNILYKDLSSQIAKSKKIMDDMREKYDKEVTDLKNNLNQFDLILKNNQFFQMNETERITVNFKKEQLLFNETSREQLKLLNEEIKKIKASQFDKNNLEIINKNFKKHTNDINMLEKSLKSWTEIAQILTKKYERLKLDKFSDDKSSNNNNNFNFNNVNFEENFNKINKYINNNKNDVYNLQLDIKEINEKAIPEIYRYINEQLKVKFNKISSNMVIDNNTNNKNINNIKNNNNISDNNMNNSIQDNLNNRNQINNNKISNNNFNDKIVSKNLEALASKIELMGSAAQNLNIKFNDNNKNKFRANSSFSRSLSDNIEKKDEEISIKEISDEDNKNDSKLKNSEFEIDFDN